MRLPRFKPCGGAVSLKFLLSLPFDVSGAIRGKISRLRYFYNNADPFEVELDSQLATVNRQEFDQAIARAAAQAGAELIDGLAVSGLAIESQAIKVLTGKGIFETKYLIGADGVYSRIGEWSGLTKKRKINSTLEIELSGLDQDPQTAFIGFGQVRQGYSWSFPKSDSYSIGIGGRGGEKLKVELDRWLTFLGYSGKRDFKISGHALPEPVIGARLQKGGLLLAGDAAGLVGPLTGEGIRYAIQSAGIAAKAIIAGEVGNYSRLIYRQISSDFRFSYLMRSLFFLWPKYCYRHGIKRESASNDLARILCGEGTFRDLFLKTGGKILNPVNLFKG